MITGASHSLSADLASAMQQYRSQMLQQSTEKPSTLPAAGGERDHPALP